MRFIIVAGLLVPSLFSQNVTVCSSGCDYTDLQTAINNINDGYTIFISSGNYTASGQLGFRIVDKSITIEWDKYKRTFVPGIRLLDSQVASLPKLIPNASPNHTMSIGYQYGDIASFDATTDRITMVTTNDYFANNKGVIFFNYASYGGILPTPLQQGVRYYMRDYDGPTNSFKVSLTKGGPAVNLLSSSTGARSARAAIWPDKHILVKLKGINLSGPTDYSKLVIGNNAQYNLDHGYGVEIEHCSIDEAGPTVWYSGADSGVLVTDSNYFIARDSLVGGKRMGSGAETTGFGVVNTINTYLINNRVRATGENIITGGSIANTSLQPVKNMIIANSLIDKPGYYFYTEGNGAPTGECFYDSATSSGERYRRADVTQNCASGACYECPSDGLWASSTPNTSGTMRTSRSNIKNLVEFKSIQGLVFINSYLRNIRQTADGGQGWGFGPSIICDGDNNAIGTFYEIGHDVRLENLVIDRSWATVFNRSSNYGTCQFTQVPLRNHLFRNIVGQRNTYTWAGGGSLYAMCEATLGAPCAYSNHTANFIIGQSNAAIGIKYKRNTFTNQNRQGFVFNTASGGPGMDGFYTDSNIFATNPAYAPVDQIYPNNFDTPFNCSPTGWGLYGNTKQVQDVYYTAGTPLINFSNPACSSYASGVIYSPTDPLFTNINTDLRLQATSPYSEDNPSATHLGTGGVSMGADAVAVYNETNQALVGRLDTSTQLALTIRRSVSTPTTITIGLANHGTSCTTTLYNSPARIAANITGSVTNTNSSNTFTSQPLSVWVKVLCPQINLNHYSTDPY